MSNLPKQTLEEVINARMSRYEKLKASGMLDNDELKDIKLRVIQEEVDRAEKEEIIIYMLPTPSGINDLTVPQRTRLSSFGTTHLLSLGLEHCDTVHKGVHVQAIRYEAHSQKEEQQQQQKTDKFLPLILFNNNNNNKHHGSPASNGNINDDPANTSRMPRDLPERPSEPFLRRRKQQLPKKMFQKKTGGKDHVNEDPVLDLVEEMRPHLKPQEGESLSRLLDAIRESDQSAIENPGMNIDECMKIIHKNDVTLITTETGTGKSTRIPHAIATMDPEAKILVTEPRRISAVQLSFRVAQLLNLKDEDLGIEIGYSVRGEHVGVIGKTRVMFVTTYALFLYLIQESPHTVPFDYIIMDEFHERPLDIQLSLVLIRAIMRHNAKSSSHKKLKLILSSATVEDNDRWMKYFSEFKVGTYHEPMALIPLPITNFYAEQVCEICGCEGPPESSESEQLNIYRTYIGADEQRKQIFGENLELDRGRPEEVSPALQIEALCRAYLLLERIAELHVDPKKSVLVFLPGRASVENASKFLTAQHGDTFHPIIWHGEVEILTIEKELEADYGSKTKVYLATDVAEVSLTLPDVVFVIDTCINKRKRTQFNNPASIAFPPLKTLWAAEANVHQRRGRIGRVRSGIYLSVLPQKHHENLSKRSRKEYCTSDLDCLVLHTLFVYNQPFRLFGRCGERPHEAVLNYGIALLQEEGYTADRRDPKCFQIAETREETKCFGLCHNSWERMLPPSVSNESSVGVTLKGFITAHVPATLEANTMLFFGCLLGNVGPSLILASVTAGNMPFASPFDPDAKKREKLIHEVSAKMLTLSESMADDGERISSDLLVSALAALRFVKEAKTNPDGEEWAEEEMMAWCEARSLVKTRLTDTAGIFYDAQERLQRFLPHFDDPTEADLRKNARLLHAISIAAYARQAVEVTREEKTVRATGNAGKGLIVPFMCVKSAKTPSVCLWEKGNICIPISMMAGQNKYMGSFTIQCTLNEFFSALLLLSATVEYAEAEDEDEAIFFKLTKHVSQHVRVFWLRCTTECGADVLYIRSLLCLKMAVIATSLEQHLSFEEAAVELGKAPHLQDRFGGSMQEVIEAIPETVDRFFKCASGGIIPVSEEPERTPGCVPKGSNAGGRMTAMPAQTHTPSEERERVVQRKTFTALPLNGSSFIPYTYPSQLRHGNENLSERRGGQRAPPLQKQQQHTTANIPATAVEKRKKKKMRERHKRSEESIDNLPDDIFAL
eukprot:gene4791-3436_t